jgi:hypothetical protein
MNQRVNVHSDADKSFQSFFDSSSSILTIQPIIYKEVSSSQEPVSLTRNTGVVSVQRIESIKKISEPELPHSYANGPKFLQVPSFNLNDKPLNTLQEYIPHVYNNPETLYAHDLLSNPNPYVASINEFNKIDEKTEVILEISDKDKITDEVDKKIVEKKKKDDHKINESISYLRKKYYLFHSPEDEENQNLPTNSVCAFCCLRQFYGFPCYIWSILFILFLTVITIFIWTLSSVIYIQNLNRSYFSTCSSNSDCDVNLLLHCAVENSCMCPASLSSGRCDCSPGYYWDGISCSLLLPYGSTKCANDYNCDPTKFLKCVNQTCSCGYQKEWISGICDYVYIGCYNDSITTTSQMFVSQTSRINYFVESCIDTCKKKSAKYSLINYYNSLNTCYCSDSFDTRTKLTCDIICPGDISSGRICGSSNGVSNIYAIYKTI